MTCSHGSYSAAGSSSCALCPPGTYASDTSGCSKCAPGRFQDRSGADDCTDCGARLASQAGASRCMPCAAGYIAVNHICVSCSPGRFSGGSAYGSATDNTCEDCPAGQSSRLGAGSCEVCAAGLFEKQHLCVTCTVGNFSKKASTLCSDCSGFRPIRKSCSPLFVDLCPVEQIQAECETCSALSDCPVGESFCNYKSVCESCARLLPTSSDLSSDQCPVLGGDCCNAFLLQQCPSQEIGPCSFCRGDIINCDTTTAVTGGWLAFVCLVALLNRGRSIFRSDGNPSKPKIIMLTAMHLVPKCLFVGGFAMAKSSTPQWEDHPLVYPLLGFLVVAATLTTSAACLLLEAHNWVAPARSGRNLVALLMSVQYLVLLVSVSAHVYIAGLNSSQREIAMVNISLDMAQLFTLQLIALASLETEQSRSTVGALYSVWDSSNCIFMTLHGIWAPWPTTQVTFLVFGAVSIGKHVLMLLLYYLYALRAPAQSRPQSFENLPGSIQNPVGSPMGLPGRKSEQPTQLNDGLVEGGDNMEALIHKKDWAKRKIFQAMSLTTLVLATGVLLIVTDGSAINPYFLVCLAGAFLPHLTRSPFVLVYIVFIILTFFDFPFANISKASPTFTIGQMWLTALLLLCDNKAQEVKSKRIAHCISLSPFLAHMCFVFGVIIWHPAMLSGSFGASMLIADIAVCAFKSWRSLLSIADNSSTQKGKPTVSLFVWLAQWASILTTGILAVSMVSNFEKIVCFCLLFFGGIVMVALMPLCKAPSRAALAVAIFSIAVDGVPTIMFAVNITTGSSKHATASLVGLTFTFKVIVCSRLAVYGLKSNWGNTEGRVWSMSWRSVASVAWMYVFFQAMLTMWSITRGTQDMSTPCIATGIECKNISDGYVNFCQNIIADSVCVHEQCSTPSSCYSTAIANAPAAEKQIDVMANGRNTSGVTTNFCTNASNDGSLSEFESRDILQDDSFLFQCSPDDVMMTVDSTVFVFTTLFYTLFAGEYVCQTQGYGSDAPWPNSCLAKLSENILQLLLSGQVLYSMLRLRVELDPLYVCYVTLDLLFILLLMLTRQLRDDYGEVSTWDWGVMFALEAWDVANCLV
eukprot:COSAG01_NODE_614_length_14830_cov_87.820572_14_plen_1089_part_00